MPFMGQKWSMDLAASTEMFWASANDVGQLVRVSLKTSKLKDPKRKMNLSNDTYLDSSFVQGVTLSTKPRR